jgi:ABC-type iron transport system FetAB permease component
VASVIDIIRRSAALGARRTKAVDEFSAASLVPAMIAMIEEAGRVGEKAVPVEAVVS